MKEKLEKREAEIETRKKTNELSNLSLSSFTAEPYVIHNLFAPLNFLIYSSSHLVPTCASFSFHNISCCFFLFLISLTT